MTDSTSYCAGDAICDLGQVRASLASRWPDEAMIEKLDRVQSWLADSPAMHAAHVEAHRVFQERKAAEWAIPRTERTVDYAETSADLEDHLGERPDPAAFEAIILDYRNLEAPTADFVARGVFRTDRVSVEPLFTWQAVAERMADELEQHIAAAARRAADEAEKIAQAGTEEYGTG